ncbi:M48 family metalloprotease [Actinokineospora sp. NBRC 105648]|uniref:M48 family metalloprotease n=1 Tax=Actinokineospora sp. NBRC 105648 TaxID=3032206 RepID=UPI0024A4768E|nr:M48 family metalloprotease [Actinokineospora sp. NBRC 105648]GLZ42194.1 membrane protein [Actinokineospora sp. NBRC 105648]
MFDHFAWSVLATPVLVLLGAWLFADRLRPDLAARVFAWSAVVAACASTVNLVVFGLKALAELPAVAALGDWSAAVVVADTAHVPWVSWVSAVWACAAVLVVAVRWTRRRRLVRAARAEVDWLEPDGDVVTVDDERIEAFALPGRPGRVVVTTGMLDVLDADQRATVIAHERAHLAGEHHRLVWLSRHAATAHPVLWPVARKVAFLVERAADEAAARELGDRRRVARAIGVAALAATRSGRGALGRGLPAALGSAPGAVPRRVSALMAPIGGLRWPGLIPVALAVGTVVWTGECVYDLHELLSLASAR